MTREIALHCMKSASELERELCEECPIYGQTGCDHCYEDALQYVIGMLEQEPPTKNDLAVEDCVSRAEVLKLMQDNWHTHNGDWAMQESMDDIRALPSVTPQEPITWIVGNDNAQIAVKNMPIDKLQKICAIIGDEQESVLDKISEEIKVMISKRGILSYSIRYINKEIDKIFDKYKAEVEPQNKEQTNETH